MITNSSFDATRCHRNDLRIEANAHGLVQEALEARRARQARMHQLLSKLGSLLYNLGTRLQEKYEQETTALPLHSITTEETA